MGGYPRVLIRKGGGEDGGTGGAFSPTTAVWGVGWFCGGVGVVGGGGGPAKLHTKHLMSGSLVHSKQARRAGRGLWLWVELWVVVVARDGKRCCRVSHRPLEAGSLLPVAVQAEYPLQLNTRYCTYQYLHHEYQSTSLTTSSNNSTSLSHYSLHSLAVSLPPPLSLCISQ